MTSIFEEYRLREQDVEHIERLRELQDTGANMETFDELEGSLLAHFGDSEAAETFNWARNQKLPMYESGVWTIEGILEEDFPVTVTLNYPNRQDQ